MQIRFIHPFDFDCNIGRSYNKIISEQIDDCWICITDMDTMPPLASEFAYQVQDLITNNPNFDAFTCMTNRVGIAEHCVPGIFDEADITKHIAKANELKAITTVEPTLICTGYCMIFHKSVWQKYKFRENLIAFDIEWSRRLMFYGLKIGLAKGIYLFHLYRFLSPNPLMERNHFLRNEIK